MSDKLKWMDELEFVIRPKKIKDLYSGACYCEIFNCIFHGLILKEKIILRKNLTPQEANSNYSLLLQAFQQKKVLKVIPIKNLLKGEPETHETFVIWMEKFYVLNKDNKDYSAKNIYFEQRKPMSNSEIVLWVNNRLESKFKNIYEFRTGAAFCQLMHIIFPEVIAIGRIFFKTNLESQYLSNYVMLEKAFSQLQISKIIPKESLTKGQAFQTNEFLRWFIRFYNCNYEGKYYDPIIERKKLPIGLDVFMNTASATADAQPSTSRTPTSAEVLIKSSLKERKVTSGNIREKELTSFYTLWWVPFPFYNCVRDPFTKGVAIATITLMTNGFGYTDDGSNVTNLFLEKDLRFMNLDDNGRISRILFLYRSQTYELKAEKIFGQLFHTKFSLLKDNLLLFTFNEYLGDTDVFMDTLVVRVVSSFVDPLGYMLLYFIVIQSITLFCSHLFTTSTTSAAISAIIIYLTTSVGGYVLHIKEIPFYWKWMEYVSPERWIYPVLLVNEFSHDTLTNSATQQLCRNRQVQHQEIIIQHPCPVPNGTAVLIETNLHQSFHIFDPINVEWTTLIVLVVASVLLFILVCCAFIFNCRRKNKEK